MMKVITANVNGIRSAAKKGFFQWLDTQKPDVVCIQESKAQEHQLNQDEHYPDNYHCVYVDALKKGYSGVAIYSKAKPDKIIRGLGEGFEDMDAEGRFVQVDIGKISIISLYLPSGSSGEERQAIKYSFMERFSEHLKGLRRKKREYIICGDWNIVHKEIDIKNWKSNQKNSGCLPEERAWLDLLFDTLGFVDAFRVVNKEPNQYTWWSNRGQARANNVGWRLDYHLITPGLKDKVKSASIYREEKFSDHAPLTIEYDI